MLVRSHLVLEVQKEAGDLEWRGWVLVPADMLVGEVLELITRDVKNHVMLV